MHTKHSAARTGRTAPRQQGFTLIELMAVILIVAILAMVSYPAYQEQVRKSRRSDARNLLLDVANREEQHILDRGSYTVSMTALGLASDPAISENGFYSVRAAAGDCGDIRTCYTLTATARGAQLDDAACREFLLDSTGARGAHAADGTTDALCW